MSGEDLLLRNNGAIVGFAKYVLDPETGNPIEVIHGHSLKQFERAGEHLVAVHNVQIFQEFEQQHYPYAYKGFEDPPVLLGDLNNIEKSFKHIVAWDKHKTARNPLPSLTTTHTSPRTVSASLIDPIRAIVEASPSKVRFTEGVRDLSNENLNPKRRRLGNAASTRHRRVSQELTDITREDFRKGQSSLSIRFDEWIDQSPDKRDAEGGNHSPEPEIVEGKAPGPGVERFKTSAERIEGSLDRSSFANDLAAEEAILLARGNSESESDSSDGRGDSEMEINAPLGLQELRGRSSGLGAQSVPLPLQYERLAATSFKKRTYRYKTRKQASPKKISNLRKKRIDLWNQTFKENPFETPRSCCNAGCFLLIDSEYTVIQYRKFLIMDRQDRKRALKSMYVRDAGAFWFGGSYVCTRFLAKGLMFSNQLQCAVKGTPKARASPSVLACPRESTTETKKNQIIVYLRDLAQRIGDCLPTKPHRNLPLMSKKQVFERFKKYNKTSDGREDPSLSYWCEIWKECCSNIKTHRHHGFTACDLCEKIRVGFEMAENERVEEILQKELEVHHEFVEEERRDYERRRDLARRSTTRYISLLVDGADQKSYGLPHFVFSIKEDKGEKLKMKIGGVLQHGAAKQLSLFTLTEEFESGANHIIEALHRVLNRTKANLRKLPPVLFVQADNCTRENKNRYFLSYLEMLVRKGVFEEVHLSFLPIGHTHADIDQAFSSVATRFKLERAVTDYDMLNLLRHCYNPRAYAQTMDEIANFSNLCENSGCLRKVTGFTQFRFFRFTRKAAVAADTRERADEFPTTCDVKFQAKDEWSPLDNSFDRDGFLKFGPDLRDTPVTDTTPPDNVLEVNKHFRSCEHRMHSVQNLQRLEALRDRIYTRRQQKFHWDLENSFEERGDYRLGSAEFDANTEIEAHIDGDTVEAEDEPYLERLNYSLNYFLAVKISRGCPDPFWIARTLRVSEVDEGGNVIKLKVRWYQAKDAEDAFTSAYAMSTYVQAGERTLFDDEIDVRSILCEFQALTRRGGLHVRTQKAIRQTLNLN